MRTLLRLGFWLASSAVAVLSLLPVEQLPPGVFDWWDKAHHALGFLVLAVLGLLGYPGMVGRVVLGLLGFGAAIEFAQSATGWRYGDWQDWLADAVGVAVAYSVWKAVRSVRPDSALMCDRPVCESNV
jgi:VanZ family protein